MKAPCFGCGKREVGCHGKCADYQAYASSLKAAKQAAYDANSIVYYYHHKDSVIKKVQGGKK